MMNTYLEKSQGVMMDAHGVSSNHIRELQPFFSVYDHVNIEKRGEQPLYAVVQHCMMHLLAIIQNIETLDERELEGLAEITHKIEHWSRAKCDFYDASWTGFLKRIFSCFRNAWTFGVFRSSGEQGLIVTSILRDEIQKRREADNFEPRECFNRVFEEAFKEFKDKAFDLFQRSNSVPIANSNDSLEVQSSSCQSLSETSSEISSEDQSQLDILESIIDKLDFIELSNPKEICDLFRQLEEDKIDEFIKKLDEGKLLAAFWICVSKDPSSLDERLNVIFKSLSETQFQKSTELDNFFKIISNNSAEVAEMLSTGQLELIASNCHTSSRFFQLVELLAGLSDLESMIEFKMQDRAKNLKNQIVMEVSNERLAKLNAIITGISKIDIIVKQNDEHKFALQNIQQLIQKKSPKNKGNIHPQELLKSFKEALLSQRSC